MKIIGLRGGGGAGKDTVADWFRKERRFLKLAFADRMKTYAYDCYRIPGEHLWGSSEARGTIIHREEREWLSIMRKRLMQSNAELIHDVMPTASADTKIMANDGLLNLFAAMKKACDAGKFCARLMLQLLGTEWGRHFDRDLWIKFVYERAIPSLSGKPLPYLLRLPEISPNDEPLMQVRNAAGIVIPDHRFANEVTSTLDRGYAVYHVCVEGLGAKDVPNGVEGHPSEVEQKSIDDPRETRLDLPFGVEKAAARLAEVFPA